MSDRVDHRADVEKGHQEDEDTRDDERHHPDGPDPQELLRAQERRGSARSTGVVVLSRGTHSRLLLATWIDAS
jgi:hypothetical protein